eukprot:CAMPEP_0195100340 /NCGR_PEP_ID=MMETSP0448-20130528/62572_1 /TAXON_ID=66468 /ORGANISM="Heterocapsa triquestra, Strain CCMP 448" /LENGTH=34 /DNA_ID= /DNA_START= /DNA_END= /DNA_ORIENTATION=
MAPSQLLFAMGIMGVACCLLCAPAFVSPRLAATS